MPRSFPKYSETRRGKYQLERGDEVVHDTYLVQVVDTQFGYVKHNGRVMSKRSFLEQMGWIGKKSRFQIFWKGTDFTHLNEWRENVRAAFQGHRVPAWDRELRYIIDEYGFDSRSGAGHSHPHGVTHNGFSRGSVLSMSLGGTGYGLGYHPFPAYPPASGAIWRKSMDPIHDRILTRMLDRDDDASQGDMQALAITGAIATLGAVAADAIAGGGDKGDATYGNRKPEDTAVVKGQGTAGGSKPTFDGSDPGPSAGQSPLEFDDASPTGLIYYWRGKWYVYYYKSNSDDPDDTEESIGEEFDRDKHQVVTEGGVCPAVEHPFIDIGFSGLVKTFVDPVTGRIIRYKGIRRKKRPYRALIHYSPFWKEQMELTQPSVLVAPSQA